MAGCYVADCGGCYCSALAGRGGMPPCGHCENHGIEQEPCDVCGCLECGCTERRIELRDIAEAYPELMP